MSAVDILLIPSAALIFTDGAVYGPGGILVEFADKCQLNEAGNLAVTGRGNYWYLPLLVKSLDVLGWTIDDLEADGGDFFEICFEKAAPLMALAPKQVNDVFVVGWSERDARPKIAQWSNCAPASVPRFSMVDSVMAPDLSDEGCRAVQANVGQLRKNKADCLKLGLEMMKAQRLEVGKAEFHAAGQYLVGHHVQVAEVTASGIRKKILHTWPEDRLGERIRPVELSESAKTANVTPFNTTNRAERRRLEKMQRRGAA